MTTEWVRAAHGDAWQVVGAGCAARGGGTLELAGVRLSATGLSHPQWNNGDVDEPDAVDLARVRAWYADLGVPWGMRVPAGARWPHGEHLFRKRLMGMTGEAFVPARAVDGVRVRAAGAADLDAVLAVDTVAFEEDEDVERPWLQVLLADVAVTVALAEADGVAAGTGYVLRSEGRAGPAAYIAGVGVLPEARRRGVGAAVTSWLVEQVPDARLWHLHPDTDAAAELYRRLGFVEVDGFDVYVNL